jgi:hypothetical protein
MKPATARRKLLLSAAALIGCGRTNREIADPLPASVGVWRRSALSDAPAARDGVIPATSIRRVRKAVYEGAGNLQVSLYELTSSAAALDAVQRWRPAANTIFFYRDQYFVVVQYETADRKAINEFVRDLDKHLTGKQ